MKKHFEDIFIKNYPVLDLHGYDRLSAVLLVNDFIEENNKLEKKNLIIIHGIGSGIIKSSTYDALKKNKLVLSYNVRLYNMGMTIVNLK